MIDVPSLTLWAIENDVLCHEAVVDRINKLLTCKWCNVRFDLQDALHQHEQMHTWLDELIDADSNSHQINCDFWSENMQNDPLLSQINFDYSNATSENMDDIYSMPHMVEDRLYTNGSDNVEKLLPTTSESAEISDVEQLNTHVQTPPIPLDFPSQYGRGEAATEKETPFIFRKAGEKTFAKNLAVESTYKVKFTNVWHGRKMRTLISQLHDMFDTVLAKARGKDTDLGRVIISHPELNNVIVVPLQKWSNLDSKTVMENIERVLNSEENLPLNDQMQVTIGNISVPTGSGRHHITRLSGPQNSPSSDQYYKCQTTITFAWRRPSADVF